MTDKLYNKLEATRLWCRFLGEAEGDSDRARLDIWLLGVVFTAMCFAWWYFPAATVGPVPTTDWGTLLTVIGVLTAITLVAPFGLAYAEFDALEERTQRTLFSLTSAYVFGALFTVTVLASYAGMGAALGTAMMPVYWAGNMLVFSIWTSAAHSRAHVREVFVSYEFAPDPIANLLRTLELARAKNAARELATRWYTDGPEGLADDWVNIAGKIIGNLSTGLGGKHPNVVEVKRKLVLAGDYLYGIRGHAPWSDEEIERAIGLAGS